MRILISFLIILLPNIALSNVEDVKKMFQDYLISMDKVEMNKISHFLTKDVIEAWGGLKNIEKNLKNEKIKKTNAKDEIIVRQGTVDKNLYFVKIKNKETDNHQEYIIEKINNKYMIKGTIGDSE